VTVDWATVVVSVLGSGGAAWAIVRGLGKHVGDRWLASHKAALDKEFEAYRDKLEQKRHRLEAELGQRVYITQIQFDTEFSALKSIFAALAKVQLTLNGIAPDVDVYIEDDQERLGDLTTRLNQLIERQNVVTDTSVGLYPFVPEDIYGEVQECMKRVQITILHLRTGGAGTFGLEWREDIARQRDSFNVHYYEAVRLSRERFSRLAVLRVE
jgi:hypothetical protein